jgi:hypothetical protein
MKTKLSVLLASVIFMNVAKAQFDVGIKAGANINKVEGKTFKEEFNYGYHLGGFARIGLGDKLGIQPEVLFNQYQTKTSSNPSDIWEDAGSDITNKEVKLNYLSIPIMLNYKLAGNFLALQAGPQFGILLNKDETLVKNGQNAFKSGDFSFAAGAQIKILKAVASARYVVGLSNISDIDNQDKWKNQAIQLSVGWAIF